MSERLEARGVTVRFPLRGQGVWPFSRGREIRAVRAVEAVDLAVRPGEMLGIAGESGCGKSTLARALVRLQKPSAGRVLLNGTPVDDLAPLAFRESVQMVFQDPYNSLNPRRSAGRIIMESLDVSVQAMVVALIEELRRDLGLGCVFISHDLNLLGYLADRLAVMYLGRIVETGPAEAVFARPLHPYTAALIEATPKPGADSRHDRVPLEGEIPSNVDVPRGCPFHARCRARIGAICDEVLPEAREVEGRLVRCHLYNDAPAADEAAA